MQVVVVGQTKGRGVVTTKPFSKGQFLCEYVGDLLTYSEAQEKEATYAVDNPEATACYMYYFRWKEVLMW